MSKITYKQKCDEIRLRWEQNQTITKEEISFVLECVRRLGGLNDDYFRKINRAKLDLNLSNKELASSNKSLNLYCKQLLKMGFSDHCKGCVYAPQCKKAEQTQIFCIRQYFDRIYNLQKMMENQEKNEK